LVGGRPALPSPGLRLTHHERERLEKEGGNSFTFVTDGIESALEQAKEAAGGKDVSLGGGAEAAQQYLAAGLIDELLLNVVPVLLGSGTRLFENLDVADVGLEQVRVVDAPGVAHLSYRRA
jgi:dihydrofolate reductase